MPRIRTAKTVAKRIDLQYFRRLHPFRRWRLMLSIALPALAGAWLLGARVTGDQDVYTSGPLSPSHAVLIQGRPWGSFRKAIPPKRPVSLGLPE